MSTASVTVTRQNIDYTTVLQTTVCAVCHCPFAIPKSMLDAARKDSSVSFFCPHGHNLVFTDNENAALRRQVENLERRRASLSAALTHEKDQHQAAKRQASAYKGQLTRARRRAGAGVCPVTECHRTVSQLAEHMRTKHPDFQP